MLDIAIAAQLAKDKMERQFALAPRRPPRPSTTTVVAEPRAPLRRATVHVLRLLADRIEPAPRYQRA